MKTVLTASWLALCAMLFMGTTCVSNRPLDPAGPYNGDTLLARYDEVLLQVEAAIDDVIAFADRNPQAVATKPGLAEAVAKIRAEVDGVANDNETLTRLLLARNAYLAAKTAANGEALEGAMRNARTLLETARSLLPLIVAP